MTVLDYGFLTDFPVILVLYRSVMVGVRRMVMDITATFGISVCRVIYIINRSLRVLSPRTTAIQRRHLTSVQEEV
jgi:hypothetical protein